MMEIILPKRTDGEREKITGTAPHRIIIIGANGAGKTRFTENLAKELSGRAYKLSALQALYDTRISGGEENSIDNLYEQSIGHSSIMGKELTTQFDRLMAMLMHEEVINLIAYKVENSVHPDVRLKRTKLDDVIKAWQEIFPSNKILLEGSRLLFTRVADADKYTSVKLSTGEKSVLYYLGSVLFAPKDAIIFVEDPSMFLHPSITNIVWEHIEKLRPDCSFVYSTHDIDFASSNNEGNVIWVRNYDTATISWDYSVLPAHTGIPDEVYLAIMGTRKPVLFIEGDAQRSIDSKLYPLVFTDFTVKSLGSCNKVIEATRAFNDLTAFHHLDSYGIVDRDRRNEQEVEYLRRKKIFVPNVAEIENILLLEGVVRTVARRHGVNENAAFAKVKKNIISMFKHEVKSQALLHTRHNVKRIVEHRIDGRFNNINLLEEHLNDLIHEVNPRGTYDSFCRKFHEYADTGNYKEVLRVFNQKSMLAGSNVAAICGIKSNSHGKQYYIQDVINALKENKEDAERIRRAIRDCFGINTSKTNEN